MVKGVRRREKLGIRHGAEWGHTVERQASPARGPKYSWDLRFYMGRNSQGIFSPKCRQRTWTNGMVQIRCKRRKAKKLSKRQWQEQLTR